MMTHGSSGSTGGTISHLAQYLAFRAFALIVWPLPDPLAACLGRTIGRLAFCLLPAKRRAMALENIRASNITFSDTRALRGAPGEPEKARPEKTGPNEINEINEVNEVNQFNEVNEFNNDAARILRALLGNLGLALVEFARLGRLGRDNIGDYVIFEGAEHLKTGLKAGKGVVVLTAHFGSWELLNAALALNGFALSAVMRELENPYMDAYIRAMRKNFGGEVIGRGGALRGMIEALKQGGIIGVLLDQRPPKKDAVMVEFFGRPAPTAKGLAAIAMRSSAAVVPVFIVREDGFRHRVICDEPVEVVDTGDKDADILENTQRFTSAIEKFVRLYPDHWLWLHSRWGRWRRKSGGPL